LAWKKPATLPTNYAVLIFKRAENAVTDQEIEDYRAGNLSDGDLGDKGIYVFRDIPNALVSLTDFAVDNGRLATYRALIKDVTTNEYSTTKDANATATAEILINTIDGKGVVVRAIEKTIDALRTANQQSKPFIQFRNIQVFRDHSMRKDEDFFVVVTRGPGQNSERYINQMIAEYGDAVVKGEVDVDVHQVEWFCMGKPLRRDQFTDLMRAMRPYLYRMIMRLGLSDIREVRMIAGPDGGGKWPSKETGVDFVSGMMTVALVIESQLQVGRIDMSLVQPTWITNYIANQN